MTTELLKEQKRKLTQFIEEKAVLSPEAITALATIEIFEAIEEIRGRFKGIPQSWPGYHRD